MADTKSGSAEPVVYVDGQPGNLPAAAWDALAWLEWMPKPSTPSLREKLERTITGLRMYLEPHLTPALVNKACGCVADEACRECLFANAARNAG